MDPKAQANLELQVRVFVTRQVGDRLQILARPAGLAQDPVMLPSSSLSTGEHPCEAAWRAVHSAVGTDSCQAFRKLHSLPDGSHYFQASPEGLGEAPLGYAWLTLSDAHAVLSPADNAASASLD